MNMTAPGAGRLPISAFCVWEIPERGVAVHLHLSAVEWLDYEIRESLRAAEGAEVGGLLLGRIESKAWNKVTIEGFTPVSCEYESGSLYHLSASDKDLLQEQLFRWKRGPGRNLYVVGFYRTHNRGDLALDGEDIALARKFFSDSAGIFLLIKPVGQRDRVAGLFLCDDGHVERQCNLIFPFSRARLTHGETTLPSIPTTDEEGLSESPAPPYLAPEESEPQPEPYTAKAKRPHFPPVEKETEPERHIPRPVPRRPPPPPPPVEKEFGPENYAPTPDPSLNQVPAQEYEADGTQPPDAPVSDELEFEPTGPPLFEPIESEAPRWRSWAPALLVTILILVFGGAALGISRQSRIAGAASQQSWYFET